MKAFRKYGFFQWGETEVAETLRHTGGDIGRGSETLIVTQPLETAIMKAKKGGGQVESGK